MEIDQENKEEKKEDEGRVLIGRQKRGRQLNDENIVPRPVRPRIEKFAELRNLNDRISHLIQRTEELDGYLDALIDQGQGDINVIYGQYEESKQLLATQVQNIKALQVQLQQYQRQAAFEQEERRDYAQVADQQIAEEDERQQVDYDNVVRSLSSSVNEFEDTLNALQVKILGIQQVRQQFNVPQVLTVETMGNYYGVYIYNKLINTVLQTLNNLQQQGQQLPIYSLIDLNVQVIIPALDAQLNVERQKQRDYLTTVNNILGNRGDEKKGEAERDRVDDQQWQDQQILVRNRIEGDQNTLNKARELAQIALNTEPRYIRQQERLIQSWVQMPIGIRNGGQYILGGIANARMFENDVAPEYQQFDPRLPVDAQNEMRLRSQPDLAWKNTPPSVKKRYLDIANQWALEQKLTEVIADQVNPKEQLVRYLRALSGFLGIKIYQYAPRLEADLQQIARGWDVENMTRQMRSSCGRNPNQNNDTQPVIPIDQWKIILGHITGDENLGGEEKFADGLSGWVVLDGESKSKFYGILHTGNVARHPGLVENSTLRTTAIGKQQGVPTVQNFEQSLDMTFLCTQRSEQVEYKGGFELNINYRLKNKAPHHIGLLLMLWGLVSNIDQDYYGTTLSVVGINDGYEEGGSWGLADTRVAAFYQRYFKYQRTSGLDTFDTNNSLYYFHPEWNAYSREVNAAAEARPEHQLMYRPYPTVSDLQDMIARLIYLSVQYYQPDLLVQPAVQQEYAAEMLEPENEAVQQMDVNNEAAREVAEMLGQLDVLPGQEQEQEQ